MIIAIDGPSGAGKSTVSDEVAKILGFSHLDTGAMFRAVAYGALKNGVDVSDEDGLAQIAENDKIVFETEEGNPAYKSILMAGEDITSQIRTDEVTKAVTPVCKHPKVREALLRQQREIGKSGNYILDGRDIGTVVFPDAELKIFLDASAEERAKRRVLQNEQSGVGSTDYDEVLADINRRDEEDSNRTVAPLRPAEDAVQLDSTSKSKQEVIDEIVRLAKEKQSEIA